MQLVKNSSNEVILNHRSKFTSFVTLCGQQNRDFMNKIEVRSNVEFSQPIVSVQGLERM